MSTPTPKRQPIQTYGLTVTRDGQREQRTIRWGVGIAYPSGLGEYPQAYGILDALRHIRTGRVLVRIGGKPGFALYPNEQLDENGNVFRIVKMDTQELRDALSTIPPRPAGATGPDPNVAAVIDEQAGWFFRTIERIEFENLPNG